MSECWDAMDDAASGLGAKKLSENRLARITEVVASLWSLSGQPTDGRRELPTSSSSQLQNPKSPEPEEFLKVVSDALPPQPWRAGIHVDLAQQLQVKPYRVTKAIQTLIARGVWMQQRDGVVFDQLGKEIMRDDSRFP